MPSPKKIRINKAIDKEVWNNFRMAVMRRHSTTYGKIDIELHNAIRHWTKHMDKGDFADEKSRTELYGRY